MSTQVAPRPRVAIVDDDIALAELVQTFLADEGMEAVMCPNLRRAHEFIRHEQPDLVLLDLRFGGGEYGWRVLDQLTLDASTARTPVILWSAAQDSLLARAPALLPRHGVFALPKPFDLDALLGTVQRALLAYPPLRRMAGQIAPGVHDLTACEREVATLVARGYSNQEIATALVLSPGVVANHVAYILQKLNCSNRAQVVNCLSVSAIDDLHVGRAPQRDRYVV